MRKLSNSQIVVMYLKDNLTQYKISKIAGVSRERIRQMLKEEIGQDKINEIKENNRKIATDEEIKKSDRNRVIRLLKKTAKGRWHWNYLACVECGSTKKTNVTIDGRCNACYERGLYRSSGERRKKIKKCNATWRENNPEAATAINRRAAKKYMRKNSEKFMEKYRTDEIYQELMKLRSRKSYYKKMGNTKKVLEIIKKIEEFKNK